MVGHLVVVDDGLEVIGALVSSTCLLGSIPAVLRQFISSW